MPEPYAAQSVTSNAYWCPRQAIFVGYVLYAWSLRKLHPEVRWKRWVAAIVVGYTLSLLLMDFYPAPHAGVAWDPELSMNLLILPVLELCISGFSTSMSFLVSTCYSSLLYLKICWLFLKWRIQRGLRGGSSPESESTPSVDQLASRRTRKSAVYTGSRYPKSTHSATVLKQELRSEICDTTGRSGGVSPSNSPEDDPPSSVSSALSRSGDFLRRSHGYLSSYDMIQPVEEESDAIASTPVVNLLSTLTTLSRRRSSFITKATGDTPNTSPTGPGSPGLAEIIATNYEYDSSNRWWNEWEESGKSTGHVPVISEN